MKRARITLNDVTNTVDVSDSIWNIYDEAVKSRLITARMREKILAYLSIFSELTKERCVEFYPNGLMAVGRLKKPMRHMMCYDDILMWFVLVNEEVNDVVVGDVSFTGEEAHRFMACMERFNRKYRFVRKDKPEREKKKDRVRATRLLDSQRRTAAVVHAESRGQWNTKRRTKRQPGR